MAVGTRARSFLIKTQIYDDSFVKMECILPVTTEYIRPDSIMVS
jgi:hypothetical protein